MNKKELARLEKIKRKKKVIFASDLVNQEDRTLLYGQLGRRRIWHVYIKDGIIHAVYYYNSDKQGPIYEEKIKDNINYLPDGLLDPYKCDFEFCKLLKEEGCQIAFNIFAECEKQEVFYGRILEDKNDE